MIAPRFIPALSFNSIRVIKNSLLEMKEFKQFRFPKSKKKRIRKKWRKRRENWKMFFWEECIHDKNSNTLYVGSKAYQQLLEKAAACNTASPPK